LIVFENGVLRRAFEPKKGEVTGGLKILHNEGLHNLSSPDIVMFIISRRTRKPEG
jgi:hypothetical protein